MKMWRMVCRGAGNAASISGEMENGENGGGETRINGKAAAENNEQIVMAKCVPGESWRHGENGGISEMKSWRRSEMAVKISQAAKQKKAAKIIIRNQKHK